MTIWKRALYMILFAFTYGVAEVVITAVVIVQFLIILITKHKNEQLLKLGHSLSLYAYEVLQFLTFNSEEKPFPIGEWPESN